MECPHCRLENPPEAIRCDCGYDFQAREMKPSFLSPTRDPDSRGPVGDAASRGIAGWLMLPAIGLALAVPLTLVTFLDLARAARPVWAALFSPVPVLVVVTAILFFSKHRWAPRAFIALLVVQVLLSALVLTGGPGPGFVAVRRLVQALAVAAIWIPYFIFSSRVRLTFTR